RRVALAVGERDPDRARTVDDVLVRDDVALRVVDEAGALRLRLGRRAAEGVRAALALLADGDLDDAAHVAAVDLVDAQRRGLSARGGRGGGRGSRGLADDGGRPGRGADGI